MEALMIGVSGMRGTVGGTLTPAVVLRMASALAVHLQRTTTPKDGKAFKVIFGRDGRPSGTFVRDAAVSALVAHGCAVVDLDIVTTPSTAYMVKALNADAGVIATASHNPIQWNGLKFLRGDAVAPPPEDAAAIRRIYDADESALVRVEQLIAPGRNGEAHGLHVSKVLELVDVLGITSKRFKVVLDSVCGAGSVPGAMLLGRLGCQTAHLNGQPTGLFPHMPEPLAENLTELCAEVRRQKAHIGFAQDPDADRLAVVDEHGTFIGEEYTLALCAKAVMGKKGSRGCIAAANLSTSRMLDDIAAQCGGRVLRTPVGEANVVQAMLRHGATLGGEGNGGVIDPRVVPGRDSLVSMAHILNLLAGTGKTVSQLVAEIPRYAILKTKFECPREDAERAVEAVKAAFAGEKVDTQDGIRIDWANSWVHARASNTEPIMRIIAEAPTAAEARQRVADVQRVVDKALASLRRFQ